MPEENKTKEEYIPFKDLFKERQIFGNTLIKFIESIEPIEIKDPNHPEETEDTRVISIDADWGFGKTTFINALKKELEKKNFTVFTYNAWENDLEEDPLASFVRAITPQIISAQDENFDYYKDYQNKMSTFISAANSVIKLATKATPIIPSIDLLKIKKEIKENKKEVFNNESVAIKCAMEISQTTKLKNDFINALDKITPKNENKIIVLIDELDRCNPKFAIELLERIKHFFNSNKYLFIFTINSKQLISSVKQIYGDGFEETGYFRRFFDYEFPLPIPNIINTEEYFNKCNIGKENIQQIQYFQSGFYQENISLRSCEKINKYINLICLIEKNNFSNDEASYLIFGIYLKFFATSIFQKLFIERKYEDHYNAEEIIKIENAYDFFKEPINTNNGKETKLKMSFQEWAFAFINANNIPQRQENTLPITYFIRTIAKNDRISDFYFSVTSLTVYTSNIFVSKEYLDLKNLNSLLLLK